MSMQRRHFTLAGAALAAGAITPLALAQQGPPWPTKPVRLMVGFPAGSTPDMVARDLAEPLARQLGQPVVVENKPGASGNIATAQIAKASDGHTLGIVINGNLTSSPLLYASLPYDAATDFCLLSLLATAPLVLVTPASLPQGPAFFAEAIKQGDRWNYGSVGAGSVAHLGMELLKERVTGLTPVHIPYNGNPAVITALIGGQIQMALVPPGLALPQVKAGKLHAVGVTSQDKSPLAPDLAPLASLGVKDFNLDVWTALVGPASLPRAVQARVAQDVASILKTAEVREQLLNQGWQAVGSSPEELGQRVKRETAVLGAIIKAQGIKLN